MSSLRLVGLTNSLRHDSFNRMALALVDECLAPDVTMQVVDLAPIPFYDTSFEKNGYPASVRYLDNAIAAADGVVIACPEYNHSIPGAMKNAIDCLSRMPTRSFEGKPIMLLSATQGMLGGARVQYELRRVLCSVGALALTRPEVFIGFAHEKFDADGRCTDEQTVGFVKAQCQAFYRWIETTRQWDARGSEQARP